MSDEFPSDQAEYSNVISAGNVTLYQGENAVNMIFVNKAENGTDCESPKSPRKQKDAAQLQQGEDEKTEVDVEESIRKAMNEIAEIQLHPATSQLQTLLIIFEKFIKMEDEAGILSTSDKIHCHFQNLPRITDSFSLAKEYMMRKKEFETIVVCKHLVSWVRSHIAVGSDATEQLKFMVLELMSLARDAVKQLFVEKVAEAKTYISYLVHMMYEMLLDVTDVPGVDAKVRIEMEALAAYYTSCLHFFLEEWEEVYQICHKAIGKMRDVCGADANKGQAFGDILFMAAMAKYRMSDLLGSEHLWEQTIEAFETNLRTSGNQQSLTSISLASQWLSIVRQQREDNLTKTASIE